MRGTVGMGVICVGALWLGRRFVHCEYGGPRAALGVLVVEGRVVD